MRQMPSLAEAIDFAIREGIRFQREFEAGRFDLLESDKKDFLWTLPLSDGRGSLICGETAHRQLFASLVRAIEASGYLGRVDDSLLYGDFKREFMRRFVECKLELTDESAAGAFQAALSQSLTRLGNYTHIFPCHLVMAQTPDELDLGHVIFKTRSSYWPTILELLKERDRSGLRSQIDLEEISSYYTEFDWLALVNVDGCEAKPSYDLAKRMAWSAIDSVQLLLGCRLGMDRMSLGGVAINCDSRIHVVLKEKQVDTLVVALKGRSVTLGDETWAETLTPDVRYLLDLLALAIGEAYRLPKAPIVAERFIDALHWYGLAMRDTEPASRLIMTVMAIEGMLLPIRTKDIESKVRKRSAPLVDWESHNARVKWIYEVRGKLVHGQLSSRAADVIDACNDAHKLSQTVLIEGLTRFGKDALRDLDVTPLLVDQALEAYADAAIKRRKEKSAAAQTIGPIGDVE